MAPPATKTDFIEAVVTCEGNLHDPDFSTKFQVIVDNLKSLLEASKREDLFHIRKIEPWNSVRVTISIPKEAAQRLKLLAQQGSSVLKDLGILSVQVEGDEVISLTLAGSNNEPTRVLLQKQHGSVSVQSSSILEDNSTTSNINTSSLHQEAQSLGIPFAIPGPSGVKLQVNPTSSSAFQTPNVLAPSGENIPCLQKHVSPSVPTRVTLAGPFPFASMMHAAHTFQRAEASPNSSSQISNDNSNSVPVTCVNVGNQSVGSLPLMNHKSNLGNVYLIGKSTNIISSETHPVLHNIHDGINSTLGASVMLTSQSGVVKSDGSQFFSNSENLSSHSAISQANSNVFSSPPSITHAPSSIGVNQSLQIQLVHASNTPPPPYPHSHQKQSVAPQPQQSWQLSSNPSGGVYVGEKPVSSPLLVNLLQHGETSSGSIARTITSPNEQTQEQISMPPPVTIAASSLESQEYYKRYQIQLQKLKRTMSSDSSMQHQSTSTNHNNIFQTSSLSTASHSQSTSATYCVVSSASSPNLKNNDSFQFSMPLPCDVPNKNNRSSEQQNINSMTIYNQSQSLSSSSITNPTSMYRMMNSAQVRALQQNTLRGVLHMQQGQTSLLASTQPSQHIVQDQNQQPPKTQQFMVNGPMPAPLAPISSQSTIAQVSSPSFVMQSLAGSTAPVTSSSQFQARPSSISTSPTALIHGSVFRGVTPLSTSSNTNIATAVHVTKIPVHQAMSTLSDQQNFHSLIPISTTSTITSLNKTSSSNCEDILTPTPRVSVSAISNTEPQLIAKVLDFEQQTLPKLNSTEISLPSQPMQGIKSTVNFSSTSVASEHNRVPPIPGCAPPQVTMGSGKPRLLGVNPLSGHSDTNVGGSGSENEDDGHLRKKTNVRRGLGKGKPVEALASILGKPQPNTLLEQTKELQKQITLLQQQEQILLQQQQQRMQSSSSLGAGSAISTGRKSSTEDNHDSSNASTGEKIKLRLKLEKNEPVLNPAYKVDISFVKKEDKLAFNNGSNSGSILSNISNSGNGCNTATSISQPNIEQPRVPPLHISLRGKNAAVVVSPRRDEKDGMVAPSSEATVTPLIPTTIDGSIEADQHPKPLIVPRVSESFKSEEIPVSVEDLAALPLDNSGKGRSKSRTKVSGWSEVNDSRKAFRDYLRTAAAGTSNRQLSKRGKYEPGKVHGKSPSLSSIMKSDSYSGDVNTVQKKAKKSRRKSDNLSKLESCGQPQPVSNAISLYNTGPLVPDDVRLEDSQLLQLLSGTVCPRLASFEKGNSLQTNDAQCSTRLKDEPRESSSPDSKTDLAILNETLVCKVEKSHKASNSELTFIKPAKNLSVTAQEIVKYSPTQNLEGCIKEESANVSSYVENISDHMESIKVDHTESIKVDHPVPLESKDFTQHPLEEDSMKHVLSQNLEVTDQKASCSITETGSAGSSNKNATVVNTNVPESELALSSAKASDSKLLSNLPASEDPAACMVEGVLHETTNTSTEQGSSTKEPEISWAGQMTHTQESVAIKAELELQDETIPSEVQAVVAENCVSDSKDKGMSKSGFTAPPDEEITENLQPINQDSFKKEASQVEVSQLESTKNTKSYHEKDTCLSDITDENPHVVAEDVSTNTTQVTPDLERSNRNTAKVFGNGNELMQKCVVDNTELQFVEKQDVQIEEEESNTERIDLDQNAVNAEKNFPDEGTKPAVEHDQYQRNSGSSQVEVSTKLEGSESSATQNSALDKVTANSESKAHLINVVEVGVDIGKEPIVLDQSNLESSTISIELPASVQDVASNVDTLDSANSQITESPANVPSNSFLVGEEIVKVREIEVTEQADLKILLKTNDCLERGEKETEVEPVVEKSVILDKPTASISLVEEPSREAAHLEAERCSIEETSKGGDGSTEDQPLSEVTGKDIIEHRKFRKDVCTSQEELNVNVNRPSNDTQYSVGSVLTIISATSSLKGSTENAGTTAEDSGIDSMDALSEKSPNQSESPLRKDSEQQSLNKLKYSSHLPASKSETKCTTEKELSTPTTSSETQCARGLSSEAVVQSDHITNSPTAIHEPVLERKIMSIPVSFLPRIDNVNLKRPLLRPKIHGTSALFRPNCSPKIGLYSKVPQKVQAKPQSTENEMVEVPLSQVENSLTQLAGPSHLGITFTQSSPVSIPNLIQISRVGTSTSGPVQQQQASSPGGLVSLSIPQSVTTNSLTSTKGTLFTIHSSTASSISQQNQQQGHPAVTVLPSGHKVVPIKLVTIPRSHQTQITSSGNSISRSSPNFIEAMKNSAFINVRTSTPIQTSPLNIGTVQVGGSGNVTLVPISAVSSTIGQVHGQQQNPVKLLVSSPLKVQPNLLKSVVVKSVMMGKPNPSISRATPVRVVGPSILSPSILNTHASTQHLPDLVKQSCVESAESGGKAYGGVIIQNQQHVPNDTLLQIPHLRKVDTHANCLYKGMHGVQLLDTSLADMNEQGFQFHAGIIHDEKDLADALASENQTVTQNGVGLSMESAYEFTHNDYDEVIPPLSRTSSKNPPSGDLTSKATTSHQGLNEAPQRQNREENQPTLLNPLPTSPVGFLRSSSPFTYSNEDGSKGFRNANHTSEPSRSPQLEDDEDDQEIIDSFSTSQSQSLPVSKPVAVDGSVKTKHFQIPDHSYNLISLPNSEEDKPMNELSIDIPNSDVIVNEVLEEKKGHIRSTRSNTRLPSPDITAFRADTPKSMKKIDVVFRNSPKASPTGSLKLLSPSVGGGSGTSSARTSPTSTSTSSTGSAKLGVKSMSKRKRQESDSSCASKDESVTEEVKELIDLNSRPGKRRCSENAVELIKACIGIEDNPKRVNSTVKKSEEIKNWKERSKKNTASLMEQEESDSLDLTVALQGRGGSRCSSEDRCSSRGSSVQRSVSGKMGMKDEDLIDGKTTMKPAQKKAQLNNSLRNKHKKATDNNVSTKSDAAANVKHPGRRSNRNPPSNVKTLTTNKRNKNDLPSESENAPATPKSDSLRRKTRSSATVITNRDGPATKRRKISKEMKS